MRVSRLLCLFGSAAVLFPVSGKTHAQNAEPVDSILANADNLSLEELLDLPIDTGSFLELDLRRSPVSLTTITKREIKASGARLLGELLEIHVPGFQYMYNKWSGEIWGMRGVAADRNDKIIFLVNGLKMNLESRNGALTETNLGLLDDIERVEVLRGPAGLIYGSGAIAGVVNIVTRTPHGSSTEVQTGYGSWNSKSVQAIANTKLLDNSVTLSFGYRKSDGAGQLNSKVFGEPADYSPKVASTGTNAPNPLGWPTDGSFGYTPGNYRASIDIAQKGLRIYARMTRQIWQTGAFFPYDPFPEYQGVPPDGTPDRYVPGYGLVGERDPLYSSEAYGNNRAEHLIDNLSINATYTVRLGDDRLKINSAVIGATDRKRFAYRTGYDILNAEAPSGALQESFGERRYLAGAQYSLKRIRKLQSALGTEFRYDRIGPDLDGIHMANRVAAHKPFAKVNYTSFALYTENFYELTKSFVVDAGVRMQWHTRTGNVFSPKIAAIYLPSPSHSIKLIGQASSNNGLADAYEYNAHFFADDGTLLAGPHLQNQTDPNSLLVPGVSSAVLHSLRPERALSVELTTTNVFNNILTIIPSVSYTSINNLFTWSQDLWRTVNAGQYSFIAAELDTRLDWRARRISAGFSHSFQRPVKHDSAGQAFEVPVTGTPTLDANGKYVVAEIPGQYRTIVENAVSDSITANGKSFLNLNTNISKLLFSYSPIPWLTIGTNLRIFWGLTGRDEIYAADNARGFSYLAISKRPMVKWNASAQIELPRSLTLGLYGYDLLGTKNSLHAARWQQMAYPAQKELYTVDLRSFAIVLTGQL